MTVVDGATILLSGVLAATTNSKTGFFSTDINFNLVHPHDVDFSLD